MLTLHENINCQKLEKIIDLTIDFYNEGKFQDIIGYIDQYLQKNPPSYELYNILGLTYIKINNNKVAYKCFLKAIEIKPNYSVSYFNIGSLYHEENIIEKAIENYEIALKFNPNYVSALFNLAILRKENGEVNKAISNYKFLLKNNQFHIESNYNLSSIYQELNRSSLAIFHLKKILEVKNYYLDTFLKLGISYHKINNLKNALHYYSEELKINKNNHEAFYLIGNVFIDKGDYNEAYKNFLKVLEINPNISKNLTRLGDIMQKKSNLDLAIKYYRRSLKLNPACVITNNNLGFAYEEKGEYFKAINCYKKSLSYDPNYFEANHNIGNSLKKIGDLDNALVYYEKALKIFPNNPDTLVNYGYINLLKGNLKNGFELYEQRLFRRDNTTRPPKVTLTWDGKESLEGKKFFVYDEQGLGDIIQFSRYLILLKEKGAIVTFKVRKELHKLISTITNDINLISHKPNHEEVDFEAPLLSLPHLFKTDIYTIPYPEKYIYADKRKIKFWKNQLDNKKFKIGINWTARKDDRSFDIDNFKKIANFKNIQLISIQKTDKINSKNIGFKIKTFKKKIDNDGDSFVDTAAIIMNCDLIITCDTSIAHLSGALGKKTWVLLKKIPDWRWMMHRSDTPWYKNVKLFRNNNMKSWEITFKKVYQQLDNLL